MDTFSTLHYYPQQGDYVFGSVCLSVCLFVSDITQNVMNRLQGKCYGGVWGGKTNKGLNFGGDLDADCPIRNYHLDLAYWLCVPSTFWHLR